METIPAKHLVTRTKYPDHWFGVQYNMNIYRGCSHGCIYCDSRSACYGNTDFDHVKAKADALRILDEDLRHIKKCGVIATGAMSDPYNPFEQAERLTAGALELIGQYGFGVAIATKSPLVVRDIGLLQTIARRAPAIVKMTITTLDDALCRKLEPGVAPSSERFRAIRRLSKAGLFCGVLMMPILSFINDTEPNVLGIAGDAAAAGARFIFPAMGMTLRTGNREYYYQHLDTLFPGLKRQYAARFGNSYECMSPRAAALLDTFKRRCDALGLLYDMDKIIAAYKDGYGEEQISFL